MELGATGRKVCPIATILSYMANPRPAGSSASGPFFIFRDGGALTRERFVKVALKAGVFRVDYYEGHSARYSDEDVGTMRECCIYVIY